MIFYYDEKFVHGIEISYNKTLKRTTMIDTYVHDPR